jgi:hypothetical protein
MRLMLNPFRLRLISLADYLNQQQQKVVDYLRHGTVCCASNSAEATTHNNDQCCRLAVRAKKLGQRVLHKTGGPRYAGDSLGLSPETDRLKV